MTQGCAPPKGSQVCQQLTHRRSLRAVPGPWWGPVLSSRPQSWPRSARGAALGKPPPVAWCWATALSAWQPGPSQGSGRQSGFASLLGLVLFGEGPGPQLRASSEGFCKAPALVWPSPNPSVYRPLLQGPLPLGTPWTSPPDLQPSRPPPWATLPAPYPGVPVEVEQCLHLMICPHPAVASITPPTLTAHCLQAACPQLLCPHTPSSPSGMPPGPD